MTTKIETLTDEYRILLWDITGQHPANDRADAVAKALRIIDAHAAERAALTEQVAQLTRERDEARALHEQALNERDEAHKALELDCWNRSHDAEYEVARLTEQVAQLTAALENIALGTVHPAEREVARLTEQVAQLTRERDAKQEDRDYWHDSSIAEGKAMLKLRGELMGQERATQQLSAEVARLTEALAAAEKKQSDTERWRGWERDRAEAAEPRMRELEAQLLTARHRHEETRQQLATCTSELAALRERVADARRKLTCPHRSDTIRVKDALEALRGS